MQAWNFKEVLAEKERHAREKQQLFAEKEEWKKRNKEASENRLQRKIDKLPAKSQKRQGKLSQTLERQRIELIKQHKQQLKDLKWEHAEQRRQLIASVKAGCRQGTGEQFVHTLKSSVTYDNALSGSLSRRSARTCFKPSLRYKQLVANVRTHPCILITWWPCILKGFWFVMLRRQKDCARQEDSTMLCNSSSVLQS